MKFLILNGPNVNLQRYSEPGMPGELDYNGMMDYVQSGCDQMGIETDVCQTNHEGDLIDEIQAAAGRVDGIVLNPGGYAHTAGASQRKYHCGAYSAAPCRAPGRAAGNASYHDAAG